MSIRQRAQEVPREAPREIEEVEVLDLEGEATDLARQRGEEGSAQGRFAIDETIERVASQHVRLDPVEGHGGRRARGSIEQRQLPEEAARADGGQDGRLRPVVGRDRDLDPARGDDEQCLAEVVDVEDGLTAAEAADPQRIGDEMERGVVEASEQPART